MARQLSRIIKSVLLYLQEYRVAVIAVDSSGIVGQPPIYFVAARLKLRHGKIDYGRQRHHITKVDKKVHDSFVNRAQGWKLKLSAVLIYDVIIPLVYAEDRILIDVDFDPSNRLIIRRYLGKLFSTYHRETPIERRPIDFRSVQESQYIWSADVKTKQARRNIMNPIENASESILNAYFNVLRKIK